MFPLDAVREELGIMVSDVLIGLAQSIKDTPEIKTVDDVLEHIVSVAAGVRVNTSA